MISISDLVYAQRQFEAATDLVESLGDGYLYFRNPFFKRLRQSSSRLGVSFSCFPGIYNYETCPNLAFAKILRNNKVPYFKNTAPLYAMQKLIPDLPINRILEIKKNNIIHETAHLIAHSILNCKPLPDEPIAAQKFFVFNALLAESFAGACETIGQFFASDNIHRWMYRQNTNVYGCDNPQYLDLLQQLSGKYSLKFCLQLAVFSFLHWNFFCLTFDQNALNQVLPFCTNSVKVSSKDHSLLLIFCRFHFNIHNWFRKQIAEFYFSSQGFNRPLAELLGFDFISFLKKNRALQIKLQKLIDIPLDTHERGKFRNEV